MVQEEAMSRPQAPLSMAVVAVVAAPAGHYPMGGGKAAGGSAAVGGRRK